ncbi:MAG: YicC/YloC family endoribonuclease [Thermoguttaceae bacterium]
MLLSMTGFGESHCRENGCAISLEVRTINSRYFKLTVRASEGYGALEPHIEELVRKAIHRGTIQVNLRVERLRPAEDYCLNLEVLQRYRRQLEEQRQWGTNEAVPLAAYLSLPGVVNETSLILREVDSDWPIIGRVLEAALKNLQRMRAEEGNSMAKDLAANCNQVRQCLTRIESRSPLVVAEYRSRLHEKLKRVLAEYSVALDAAELIREVSLFADRCDISEELVRLRSHVEQFLATMDLPESSGRKLEFITQEMMREANTIGAKANDVEIAREVIEIKTAIERIREMIQNIE